MSTVMARNYSAVIRRFGVAGFVFFFVKGMLWLAAPFVFAWFI